MKEAEPREGFNDTVLADASYARADTPAFGDVLDVRDAALILGVSERRLRQLLASGHIQGARRLGRAWIIPNPFKFVPNDRSPRQI